MPEKTLQEFLKTANTFAQEPWQLLKTQAWLESFCEQNQSRAFPDPVPLVHLFHPKESLLPLSVDMEEVVLDAAEPAADPPAPRNVRVLRPKRKALKRPSAPACQLGRRVVMRRPAAAAAAAARGPAEAAGADGDEVAAAAAAAAAAPGPLAAPPPEPPASPGSLHGSDFFILLI